MNKSLFEDFLQKAKVSEEQLTFRAQGRADHYTGTDRAGRVFPTVDAS